eukprot:SM000052S17775  [mRNA]  locus=s52:712722:713732:+ [translate_table: standard]
MASAERDADLVEVCDEPLALDRYVDAVSDASAGGIAVFVGTTRDTFGGRRVRRLEYEAYVPMATSKLAEICRAARSLWPIVGIALAHRLGVVGAGQASVVVAVSSVHRKEALEACQYAIDEIKATAPIWKKEVYEDGEVWKENQEYRDRLHQQGLAALCSSR